MKKHPAIIITLVIFLLLLNGGIFAWMMRGQMEQTEKEAAQAARTSGEEISEAAAAVFDTSEKAQAQLAKTLAAEHVYAHRASSGISLEHSFRQYDEAIEDGARYIEQDIVISKDDTLYVSHDLSASRMTGTNRAFADMTDSEIDQLTTHAGEKTLRLSEVFDRYGTSIVYVIELKSADRNTIDAFARTIDQYGFQEQVIVQCFYLDTLQALEEIYPDMPKMYLCKYPADLNPGYEASYVDIISVEMSMMNEENVDRAHEDGKQFNIWPLTNAGAKLSEKQIRRAIDLGVDSYFTDDVKTAIEVEETYGYEHRYLN